MNKNSQRRTDALSKARIVEAAIRILDADGEAALTFRALSARLATGSGAIYWHVANKEELLAAATEAVLAPVLAEQAEVRAPRAEIRALALGVFDVIDAHPWVGAQLIREPGQGSLLPIFEGLGQRLLALDVCESRLFVAASALLNYVLGVAGQNAANGRLVAPGTDRRALLGAIATRWLALDPVTHPFAHKVAAQLPEHDDREQFLAGIDLILAGIETERRSDEAPA